MTADGAIKFLSSLIGASVLLAFAWAIVDATVQQARRTRTPRSRYERARDK